GPLDVHEVLIAAERELSEGEAPIAVRVGLGRLDGGCCLNAHGILSLGIRSPRTAGAQPPAVLRLARPEIRSRALSQGLADVSPSILRVVAGDRLQQDH